MANHGCINETLDGVDYSSPMPLIGLYVAVASFLCLALMLYDVAVAYHASKHWLPSKLFGFNSATMTLLSVAVKIPVDLTTSMPSPQDQLSKLAGTVLICISMAFLMPSLGANSESECFTNMLGFSIFVITVAVNICIQIHTGVIVLFVTAHIIVLCMMLVLLVMLWYISFYIKGERRMTNDQLNNLLAKGDHSMFGRVRLCHLYVYCSDPQFKISVHPINAAVTTIAFLCFGVLGGATIRSVILKDLKFCKGNSDYDWSIIYIVIVQVLTALVGTSAIYFRWLRLFNRMTSDSIRTYTSAVGDDGNSDLVKKTLRKELTRYILLKFFVSVSKKVISIAQLLIALPWLLGRRMFNSYRPDSLEYFDALPHEGKICAPGYMAQKGVDELIRFKIHVASNGSLNKLRQFLSQNNLSREGDYLSKNYREYLGQQDRKVCFLSIALLVKIAEASIPNDYLGCQMLDAFKEAMEIIHFVDKMMIPISPDSMKMLSYAKHLSISGDFTWMFSDDINGIQPAIKCTTAKLNKINQMLISDKILSEVGHLINLINPQSYSSVEELVRYIEQMFADMLHTLLSQLPLAIYKMLNEGPMERFEERIRFAMKLVFQTQSLDGNINWLFPRGSEISSFGAFDSDFLHYPFQRSAGPVDRLVEDVHLRVYDDEGTNGEDVHLRVYDDEGTNGEEGV